MQVRYLITFTCGVLIITLNTSWWWSDEEQNSKHCSFNIILVTGVFSYMFPYTQPFWRPSRSSSYCSWIYNYICNQCLSPLMLWVRISKTTRCTALRDKVCQWLTTGRWFSPGTPVSSTKKTDRHDITEILLKVASNTITLAPMIMMYLTLQSVRNCDRSVVFSGYSGFLHQKNWRPR